MSFQRFCAFFAFFFFFSITGCGSPNPDPTDPTPQQMAKWDERSQVVTQDPKWDLSQPSGRFQRASDWVGDKLTWFEENVGKPLAIGFLMLLIFALGNGGATAILIFNPGIVLGKVEIAIEGLWLLLWSYLLWKVKWPPEVQEASRIIFWSTFAPGVILTLAGLAGKTEGGWKLVAVYAPSIMLMLGYVLALIEMGSGWIVSGSLLSTYVLFRLFSILLPRLKKSSADAHPAPTDAAPAAHH